MFGAWNGLDCKKIFIFFILGFFFGSVYIFANIVVIQLHKNFIMELFQTDMIRTSLLFSYF